MDTTTTNFIGRISQTLGRTSPPETIPDLEPPNRIQEAYLDGASPEELRDTFKENAEAVGTKVYMTSPEELNAAIMEAVTTFPEGTILFSDEPYWREQNSIPSLEETGRDVRVWSLDNSSEQNIEIAENAAVGVATAKLALAETGTVMVYSHDGCGRAVTLLPTTTIYVIHARDIVPRLTQAMAFLKNQAAGGLPSSVNFISAASSTADIELVRVQGVHGPLEIAYIIVE